MYLFSSPKNLSISKSLEIFLSDNNLCINFNFSSSLSALSKGSIIFVDSVRLSGGAKVPALLSLFLTS